MILYHNYSNHSAPLNKIAARDIEKTLNNFRSLFANQLRDFDIRFASLTKMAARAKNRKKHCELLLVLNWRMDFEIIALEYFLNDPYQICSNRSAPLNHWLPELKLGDKL